MPRHALLALSMGLIWSATGCAGAGGLADWRGSVERYVREQGQGDPTVLRQVTWPQSRHAFGKFGGDDPAQVQDSKGILLSVETIGNDNWMIFIVGEVNRNVVQDIRLVALNVKDGRFTWRTSPADREALRTYQGYYEQLVLQRFPNRPDPPTQYTTFPKETDIFTLRSDGGGVVVTHPASSAQWELTIDAKASKGSAVTQAGGR